MNKKILVIACLVMITTVFSGCDLLGGDKNKGGIENENSGEQNQESNGDEESSNNDGSSCWCVVRIW